MLKPSLTVCAAPPAGDPGNPEAITRKADAYERSGQRDKARALLAGRSHVLPDDLKELARAVLPHRIVLRGSGDAAALVDAIVAETAVAL